MLVLKRSIPARSEHGAFNPVFFYARRTLRSLEAPFWRSFLYPVLRCPISCDLSLFTRSSRTSALRKRSALIPILSPQMDPLIICARECGKAPLLTSFF